MARPVGADAEKTRARILESAQALFGARGLSGVSVRKIAAGAGVTLATVHHYFGGKDDLYRACVDSMYRELTELAARLERELRGVTEVESLVDRAVREGFRFARARQTAVRLLLRSVVEAGELDPARRDLLQIPFLERGSQLLGARLGRPPGALRLPLQSAVVLTARYAASTDAELARFAGARDPEAARRAVEEHLAATALALLKEVPE